VTLIDRNEAVVFGFSKLDVMFGRTVPDAVRHPYRDAVKHACTSSRARFGRSTPAPSGSRPTTARSRPICWWSRRGRLVQRGLRERSEIALAMDFGRPITPSPDASAALVEAFAARDIEWHPRTEVSALDPARKLATVRDGGEMPYDLFPAVPIHRTPAVVVDAGLTTDGWIGVDPLTFETSFDGVYAIGDVAAVGTPRAGVFAEGHAEVAAEHIAARIRGETSDARYGGRGVCYLEFGDGRLAMVDVTFLGDQRIGRLIGPSESLVAEKAELGSSRVRGWFGRDWSAVAA
jgi:sulfide:quinone oxidoreductase